MANNGVYYSSAHTLNFTTTGTTWATLTSGGTFLMNAVSATTYYNLPVSGLTGGSNISVTGSNGNYTISYTGTSGTSGDYLPLSGGTVTGGTVFTNGVTANTISNLTYISFNTTATTSHVEGQIHWNDETKTLEIDTDKTGVTYEAGQNTLVRVTNQTGSALSAGTVVYINGAQGQRPTVTKASYELDQSSARTLGFVTANINDNNQGYVTTNGLLRNVDTNSYTAGTQLYLYTGGTVTNVRPIAPNHEVRLGYVITQNSTTGVIYVNVQNGYELEELHDVQITAKTNNDIIYWDNSVGVWKNTNSPVLTSLTAGTISATTYQNLPTDIRTTGATYSNNTFTYTNNTGGTYSVLFNTVTGLTVNGGLNVTGQTTSATISATTYLNLPQSVSGGGTTNYISKWTGSTGLGDSQIIDDGTQVYIGTVPTHAGTLFNGVRIEVGEGIQILGRAGSIGMTDTDLSSWTSGGGEIAIGTGAPLAGSTGVGNIGIGYQSMSTNSTGINNTALGFRSLLSNQSGQGNIALGYRAGINVDSGSYNVLIGYEAGSDLTTEDNRLYIANNTYGTLIYGEFDNGIVNIDGTLSATTYDNLPGSSSANCFTTFYVTNISGCSPVNVLSPLNVKDGLSVTGTSTFINQVNFDGGISASTFSAATYQNLPSFNSAQINGVTQFSGDTNNFINFSGINVTITSAATNTLVFSAGTGGGGGVTSVTAGSGLSGSSTTGAITLINTQVQGITGITASSGISASTSDNVVTLTNTGVTGITAGTNITINQSTGNVTINSTGGGSSLGSVYTTANNFNFL